MYVWAEGDGINACSCREGVFQVDPNIGITLDLTMVYENGKSRVTFGSCKVSQDIFSPNTLEMLQEFIKHAERDYALIVAGKKKVEDPYSKTSLEHETPKLHMPLGG